MNLQHNTVNIGESETASRRGLFSGSVILLALAEWDLTFSGQRRSLF